MMLVTSLCWRLYDGDLFQMLAAELLSWPFFLYVDDFQYPSPTSM